MTISYQDLGQRLRRAREAIGLTQEAVARHLDLSRSSVAQMELGKRAVSGLELDRLAYLYGRDLRDFLAPVFDPEASLMALFRAAAEAGGDQVLEAASRCIALTREMIHLEELLALDRAQLGVPAYPASSPKTRWQAIQQGTQAAQEERRRLGLGMLPSGDVADLLESQGVRTLLVDLPEDISGLTLMDPGLGLAVAANRRHHLLRRRFSWVHEYAHVLFDRRQKGTLSRTADREVLTEVRANAFAAAFLLPAEGVQQFLTELGKGQSSREHWDVFDETSVVSAEGRREPRSQNVQIYDVALLAHHFEVSRTAALYRLRNLKLIAQRELDHLLQEERRGRGKSIARLLGLPEPDTSDRDKFRARFLGLALEACRREKITRRKLIELAEVLDPREADLDQLFAGVDLLEDAPEDSGDEVLLPGDL